MQLQNDFQKYCNCIWMNFPFNCFNLLNFRHQHAFYLTLQMQDMMIPIQITVKDAIGASYLMLIIAIIRPDK